MHKMWSDERKCAVMNGGFCIDELQRNEKLARKSHEKVEREV